MDYKKTTDLKISVITPSFNQGGYIEHTIKSVLNQNYPDFEHIIVDGGSTDNTIHILKKYPHVRWISESDKGQADALNKGLKMANGDIIAWINSDDYYCNNAFESVTRAFKTIPEAKVIVGESYFFFESSSQLLKGYNRELDFEGLLRFWDGGVPPTQPSLFFKSEIIKECGYLDITLNYTMDYEYWLRIGRKYKFYHIPSFLSVYRFHGNSKSGFMEWSPFFPEYNEVYMRYKSFSSILPDNPLVTVSIPLEGTKANLEKGYGAELKEVVNQITRQKMRDMEILIITDSAGHIELFKEIETEIPVRPVIVDAVNEKTFYEAISKEAKGLAVYIPSMKNLFHFQWFSWALTEIIMKPMTSCFMDRDNLYYNGISALSFPDNECSLLLNRSLFKQLETFSFPEASSPELSIILPVTEESIFLYDSLRSIFANVAFTTYEVIAVIDVEIKNPLISASLKTINNIILITLEEEMNFFNACQQGAQRASGKYLMFIRGDVLVQPMCVSFMKSTFNEYKKTGAVGVKLVNNEGRLTEAGEILWNDGEVWAYGTRDEPEEEKYCFVREVDALSMNCIMIDRAAWDKCGGLNEECIQSDCADIDLFCALRKGGYRVIYQPDAVAIQLFMEGSVKDFNCKYSVIRKNSLKIYDKWKGYLKENHLSKEPLLLTRAARHGRRPEILIVTDKIELAENPGPINTEPVNDLPSLHNIIYSFIKNQWNVSVSTLVLPDNDTLSALRKMSAEIINNIDDYEDFLDERRFLYDLVWIADRGFGMSILHQLRSLCGDMKIVYDAPETVIPENSSKEEDTHRVQDTYLVNSSDLIVVHSDTVKNYITGIDENAKIHSSHGKTGQIDVPALLSHLDIGDSGVRGDVESLSRWMGYNRMQLTFKKYLLSDVREYSGNRPVYIWGTGKGGEETLRILESMAVNVSGFLDSNSDKWGDMMFGYKVYPSYIIKEKKQILPYIVIGSMQREEMEHQLRENGFKEKTDYTANVFTK